MNDSQDRAIEVFSATFSNSPETGDGVGHPGNSNPVAPTGIPLVLALALEVRAAVSRARDSLSDSGDERRQPPLGSAPDPWRAAQAWHRGQPSDGRQVHGAKPGKPSPNWRSFLRHHAEGIAAIDMFVVASASFRLLYVMIILPTSQEDHAHGCHPHPTAAWLSRQVTEAFPWDTSPRYLLRDRDASYGSEFRSRVEAMNIAEVITAPRSPWQNAYVERVIGSIRRECLDHVVIFNERHLRRVVSSYVDYYQRSRTHLSLDKDCPESRPIQRSVGRIVAIPKVGGLHHRYERLAA